MVYTSILISCIWLSISESISGMLAYSFLFYLCCIFIRFENQSDKHLWKDFGSDLFVSFFSFLFTKYNLRRVVCRSSLKIWYNNSVNPFVPGSFYYIILLARNHFITILILFVLSLFRLLTSWFHFGSFAKSGK